MISEEFERQLEELHAAGFSWALGRCGWNREEAEEVMQMTYLKILEGRARYGGRSSLKTWLFALIRNTASENRRRAFFRRIFLSRLRPSSSVSSAHDFADRIKETERRRRILCILRSLPVRQREVLDLVFYQDLTIEDAAKVMGVSLGTARTHYERGKSRLREKLTMENVP